MLILFKEPIASIIPPNTIAHITSQIVLSIPFIPPLVNKSFKSGFPDSIEVSTVIAFKMETYASFIVSVLDPDICFRTSGWKITANTAPSIVPINRAIRGGVFLKIIKTTIIGTIKTKGFILNVLLIVLIKTSLSVGPVETTKKFNSINTIKVMIIVGTVVRVKYLIWVNRSDPEIAGARFVVSLKGDNLSPKYAPEIIAPAAIPVGIPIALDIPMSAIPTVADVVQLLPVAKDIIAHITTQDGKKTEGWRIFNP